MARRQRDQSNMSYYTGRVMDENPSKRKLSIQQILMIGILLGVLVIGIILILPDPPADDLTAYQFSQPEKTFNATPIPETEQAGGANAADNRMTVQDSFAPLLEQNPDTVGYIRMPNTLVEYPVVQCEDNDFYMDRGFDKRHNEAGAIFMDFRNEIQSIGQYNNIILYGHHMQDDSMFATVTNYYSQTFFDENPVFEFNTLYKNYKWEVFAAYPTNVDFYYIETIFYSPEDYENFVLECKSKSMHYNDVIPTRHDTILTLSTCFYNGEGERFVVQARLISEE